MSDRYRELSIEEVRRRQVSLADRHAALTPVRLAVVPETEREELRVASSALDFELQTVDDARSAMPELDRLEDAIDRVEQLAAPLAEFDGRFVGTAGEFAQHSLVTTMIRHLVWPWQRTLLRVGDRLVARVALDSVVVDFRGMVHESEGRFRRIELETTTRMPNGLGPIEVRPQNARDVVASVFGRRTEWEVGMTAFDRAYWLTGREDAIRALVTEAVAREMVSLESLSPTLSIGEGSASLRWTVDAPEAIAGLRIESGTERREHADKILLPACFELHGKLRSALR